MADFQDKKIPIFTGVNDIPVAPTADSGGNISHLYDKYNQLIDDIEATVTTVEQIAGDGFDKAELAINVANSSGNIAYYYYYTSLPNRQYIIIQNLNTTFDLGNHNLVSGTNTIGNIPANGELIRIIAQGSINNFIDLQWSIGNLTLSPIKVATYSTGGIWWFYDLENLFSPSISENDVINVITTNIETNINFQIEMAVNSVNPSTLQPVVENR